MTPEEKTWIEDALSKLNFVKWDRFFSFPSYGILTVFGWIDREKDSYKDFVILEFTLLPNKDPSCVYFLGTSSAKHSKKIAEILGSQHAECKRVESFFDIKNKIILSKKEGQEA